MAVGDRKEETKILKTDEDEAAGLDQKHMFFFGTRIFFNPYFRIRRVFEGMKLEP